MKQKKDPITKFVSDSAKRAEKNLDKLERVLKGLLEGFREIEEKEKRATRKKR